MQAFPPQSGLPAELRDLRRLARRTILFSLVLLPPVLAWLADRAGMGWELVTLLGASLALGAAGAQRTHVRPTVLAAGLGAGCVLVLGAGHGGLPYGVATALPFLALALAAALCSGRALGAALAILLGPAVLAPAVLAPEWGMALALAGFAAMAWLAQRVAFRVLAGRTVVLVPSRAPSAPVWTRPAEGFALPGLLVQAERGADGAVRLAVAGHAAGRLRVSVR